MLIRGDEPFFLSRINEAGEVWCRRGTDAGLSNLITVFEFRDVLLEQSNGLNVGLEKGGETFVECSIKVR